MKISFYDPEEDQPRQKRDKNSSFTLDWVSELGWTQNPFLLENRIAGFAHEEHEINLFFIKQRRFATITGPSGSGKTTLINWLASELEDKKDFVVIRLNGYNIASDGQLRIELADAFRSMFSRGRDIETTKLLELLEKKTSKQQLVILIDDADEFEESHSEVLTDVLRLAHTQILLTAQKLPKTLPADDELELVLKKRNAKQYTEILIDRIEAVGGEQTQPFTDSAIKQMAKETDTTQSFLQLAHETAIHIALNKVTGDDEDEQEIIQEAEKITHKTTSSGVKGRQKTKYDDLIESLGEELTK